MRQVIKVRIYDAFLGIWQDDPRDNSYRSEVYGPLIRLLRNRGWKIGADPKVKKHYACLSPDHRLCSRGTLRASIELAGRSIEVQFWSETAKLDNRNGKRYDFNKMQRMSYLDRLRIVIERRHIVRWLETIAPISIDEDPYKPLLAMDKIAKDYAESCHSDKDLGRPVCECSYNAKSADGKQVEHGATVWFAGYDGRMRRGTAYYNINSMWWVVCDKWTRLNLSCHQIFCDKPADLRTKRNERLRRARLERELATAISKMNFQRAETIKQILFGNEEIWLIYARDKQAYYGSNYCGYTSDRITAGKYSRVEAEKEARRVPHELEARGPNGESLRFDKAA